MTAYILISSFIALLGLIPIGVHYLTFIGHFTKMAEYSEWALFIWIAFGFVFLFAIVKNLWMRLFMLSILISYILNLGSIADLLRREYMAAMLFFLGVASMGLAGAKRIYAYAVVGIAVINIIMAIAQYYGFWWFLVKNSDFLGSTGFMYNTNYFGAFIAASAPLFLLLPGALKLTWVLALIGIELSNSTTAMLAFSGASIYLAVKYLRVRKLALAIIISLLLFGLIYDYRKDLTSFYFRARVWNATIEESFKPPASKILFGRGFGSYLVKFNIKHQDLADGEGRFWSSSHNQYLDVLYEQGLFGFIIVLFFLISILRRAKRATGNSIFYYASLIAIAIDALAFFPMRIPMIAATAAVSLSALEVHNG